MKRPLRLLLPFMIFYSVLNPAVASAVPSEATLFPDSARIVDVSPVQLLPAGGDGTLKAVIVLPGQTIPDSLTAALPAGSPLRILDQSWQQTEKTVNSLIWLMELPAGRSISISGTIRVEPPKIWIWTSAGAADNVSKGNCIGRKILEDSRHPDYRWNDCDDGRS